MADASRADAIVAEYAPIFLRESHGSTVAFLDVYHSFRLAYAEDSAQHNFPHFRDVRAALLDAGYRLKRARGSSVYLLRDTDWADPLFAEESAQRRTSH